ncbi:MAG: MFS transporter [Bacteroidota bacterium]
MLLLPRPALFAAVSTPPSPASTPTAAPKRSLGALLVTYTFSSLADGVYFVALPWLALELIGSAAALGGVLALAALPRTAFMVIGGAWADRFAPQRLLAASSAASALVTGLLAAAASGWLSTPAPWMLYTAAALLGVVDAVAYPAASALVPRLVASERLHRVNGMMGVLLQVATFLGPAAAAGALAWGGSAAALVLSAALSLVAVGTALVIRVPSVSASGYPDEETPEASSGGTLRAIVEGFRFVRRRPVVFAVIVLMAGLNLGLAGPIIVGGAVLAEVRYGGAGVFGAIVSAWGAGGLVGSLVASVRAPASPVAWTVALSGVLGVAMGLWALPMPLFALLAVTAAMGLADGWLEVHAYTWIQQQTPLAMQGRVMALTMLALVGVEPVSHVVGGVLAETSLSGLFVGGATLTIVATIVAGLVIARQVRTARRQTR